MAKWRCYLAVVLIASSICAVLFAIEIAYPTEAPRQEQRYAGAQRHPAQQDPFYRFWEWSTNDPVAFFTMILSLFTGSLVGVSAIQIRYLIRADQTARTVADAALSQARASEAHAGHMRESVEIARQTADAAIRQAEYMRGTRGLMEQQTRAARSAARAAGTSASIAIDAARNIERPYVFIGNLSAEYTVVQGLEHMLSGTVNSAKNAIEFTFTLRNYGRTPAVVYEACEQVFVCAFRDGEKVPPEEPEYSSGVARGVFEIIEESGTTKTQTFTYKPKALPSPISAVPLFYGYIRYRDVSGRKYQAGFGFTWSGGNFSPYNEAYNYDRELTESE